MKFFLPLITLIYFSSVSNWAQKPEKAPHEISHLKIVNVSTAESLSFLVDDNVRYSDLRFGDKISKFTAQNRFSNFKIINNKNDLNLDISLELEPDSYNSLLILGSFEPLPEGENSSAKSDTHIDAKYMVFRHTPHTKTLLFQYRFVNIIKDETITISINDKSPFTVGYLDDVLQEYQPKDCTFKVNGTNPEEKPLLIKLLQESPYSNAYFVIYRKEGKLAYMAIPLHLPKNV